MDEDAKRPDPDAIVRRLQAEQDRQSRARLKIFLGFAPGVGKTYRMLLAARELVVQDVDLLVGVVETHGRFDTAGLLLGLEILPRRAMEYRGRSFEEFHLDAAVARKPKLILLDELAHTNVPGSRHTKRWQDVLELLDAGIDVFTTLNVQHVESLNDVVAQITTIRVRETVPDAVLDRADEIELVDVSPDELLQRLKEGKVYLPEQISQAAENFFRRGNLLALRELALREMAARVDADVQAFRKEHEVRATWPTAERILVCVGPAPGSARLVRTACRMAAGLRAPWVAAYVETTTAAQAPRADREDLESHLRLAESLGGDVVRLDGHRASEAILDYARRHNVTRIVIGKPGRRRLRELVRGSLFDDLVRGSGDIDVHVVPGDAGAAPEDRRSAPARRERRGYAESILLVSAATGLSFILREILATPDVVMLYLLVIMITAIRSGRGPSLLAAALSVGCYDFFFIPPHYTFAVANLRHILTFAMMFAVGVLISSLTLRIRRHEQESRLREGRTATLLTLSRALGEAVDEGQAAETAARKAAEILGGGAVVLLPDAASGLLPREGSAGPLQLDAQDTAVAQWAFEHGRPAGIGTDTLPGSRILAVPVQAGPEIFGVMALIPEERLPPTSEQRHFLDALARQTAMAIGRARLAERAKVTALRARVEEMRSSLLSAVSHDLRTPLAAITGAASTLRDGLPALSEDQRRELLDAVCDEAERLERLVANLLDMTRLESGTITVKRDWVPLEEIVGSTLMRLEKKLAAHVVTTDLPDDLPLISVDPVLMEQLFVNLLENAAKYTPAGTPVEIRARAQGQSVTVEVADRGPGIAPGHEEKVFEKFHREEHRGVSGVGLGLPICRGIAQAHGGTLSASNRAGGGAVFRLTIPPAGRAPAVPMDAPEEREP